MEEIDGLLPQSLRPASHQANDSESLLLILGRIYEERGHFKDVTEQSLEAEIAAQDNGETASIAESEQDEEQVLKESKSRPEELRAARQELLGHIASAQNELGIALDFVSLLVSKDQPRQAELSMSPFLKAQVKSGTLGFDMWQNMKADAQKERTDTKMARGWKVNSLQKSADSLLDAASKLESNVRRETEYWNQVLSVSERGWSVCRMPRERHNLGVRYGFSEARGEFGRRGLAALRSDSEGHVVLDRGFGNNPKAIRVRVVQGSETISTSEVPALKDDSEFTVEARIRHARDSLYEEELFHEAMRESRSLFSYGVRIEGNCIRIPSPSGSTVDEDAQHVLVDLVPLDGTVQTGSTGSGTFAEAIALAFRLLLSQTHRKRLDERSNVPPALSLNKADPPVAQILRPIMAVSAHDAGIRAISTYTARLDALSAAASIAVSVAEPSWSSVGLQAGSSIHELMDRVTAPLQSHATFAIEFKQGGARNEIRIEIQTGLEDPSYGTMFRVSSTNRPDRITFDTAKEVAQHVDAVIAGEIAREAVGADADWRVDARDASISRRHVFGASKSDNIKICLDSGMRGQIIEAARLSVRRADAEVVWATDREGERRQLAETINELRRTIG
ncbi:hypothetical protein MBLNU457_6007t2 [Dothideomycetes sp. NU457]